MNQQNYEIEIQRSNVTLAAFLSAVRAGGRKQGVEIDIDRLEFESPSMPGDTRYHVKDGVKFNTSNGYRVEMPGEDAAYKSEICRALPLDAQTYVENLDGSSYNEIIEFTFDDDKRGHGYYYQAQKGYSETPSQTFAGPNAETVQEIKTMEATNTNPVIEHAKAKGLYAVKNTEGVPIYVQRGRLGYTSIDCGDEFWQELHDARTQEQNELAVACSMFGWDIPVATRLAD